MGINSRTLTSKKPRLLGRGIQRLSLDRATIAGGVNAGPTPAPTTEGD